MHKIHQARTSEEVEAALAEDEFTDYFDENGETPLFVASKNGLLPVVSSLLAHGADINDGNDKGETPLMIACQKGHTFVVQHLLLQPDVFDESHDYSSDSPLLRASKEGHVDIVEMLLDHGVSVNARNREWSALMSACETGKVDVVDRLLHRGASVNAFSSTGHSPLGLACFNGCLGIVDRLILFGAQINRREDEFSEVPIVKASEKGHADVVGRLVSCGADVDARGFFGGSALFEACKRGHVDVARILLKAKAETVDVLVDSQFFPCPPFPDDIIDLLQSKKLS